MMTGSTAARQRPWASCSSTSCPQPRTQGTSAGRRLTWGMRPPGSRWAGRRAGPPVGPGHHPGERPSMPRAGRRGPTSATQSRAVPPPSRPLRRRRPERTPASWRPYGPGTRTGGGAGHRRSCRAGARLRRSYGPSAAGCRARRRSQGDPGFDSDDPLRDPRDRVYGDGVAHLLVPMGVGLPIDGGPIVRKALQSLALHSNGGQPPNN